MPPRIRIIAAWTTQKRKLRNRAWNSVDYFMSIQSPEDLRNEIEACRRFDNILKYLSTRLFYARGYVQIFLMTFKTSTMNRKGTKRIYEASCECFSTDNGPYLLKLPFLLPVYRHTSTSPLIWEWNKKIVKTSRISPKVPMRLTVQSNIWTDLWFQLKINNVTEKEESTWSEKKKRENE